MPSNKDGGRWFETDLKPNGSTGYAILRSILESDLKFGLKERAEKPIFKMNSKHNKVYVDNLAAVTTERDLMDLFSPYGNVAQVNIVVDRANHKSRGFGFVTMATSEGARSAIQALNGKAVGTRTLTVSEAWPNEERTTSSRGPEVPAAIPAILTQQPVKGKA